MTKLTAAQAKIARQGSQINKLETERDKKSQQVIELNIDLKIAESECATHKREAIDFCDQVASLTRLCNDQVERLTSASEHVAIQQGRLQEQGEEISGLAARAGNQSAAIRSRDEKIEELEYIIAKLLDETMPEEEDSTGTGDEEQDEDDGEQDFPDEPVPEDEGGTFKPFFELPEMSQDAGEMEARVIAALLESSQDEIAEAMKNAMTPPPGGKTPDAKPLSAMQKERAALIKKGLTRG